MSCCCCQRLRSGARIYILLTVALILAALVVFGGDSSTALTDVFQWPSESDATEPPTESPQVDVAQPQTERPPDAPDDAAVIDTAALFITVNGEEKQVRKKSWADDNGGGFGKGPQALFVKKKKHSNMSLLGTSLKFQGQNTLPDTALAIENSPPKKQKDPSAPPTPRPDSKCSTRGLAAVTLLVGQKMAGKFGSCALVGGSHSLLTRRDGELIDRHEAVIRINRLPPKRYAPFMGRRTTVYFAGAVADKVHRFVEEGYLAQLVNKSGSSVQCRYVGKTCPFDNLVMNAGKLQYNESWERKYPLWKPGWRPKRSDYPIGYMSTTTLNVVRLAQQYVLGFRPPLRVTSGIQAFFMTAMLCDKIDIFGMASPGTVDNHLISQLHDVVKERNFLQKVSQGGNVTADGCLHNEYKKDCKSLNRILCSMSRRARDGHFVLRLPPVARRPVNRTAFTRVYTSNSKRKDRYGDSSQHWSTRGHLGKKAGQETSKDESAARLAEARQKQAMKGKNAPAAGVEAGGLAKRTN